MYPDDYLSSYESIEEADGRVTLRSKIKATRCRHCDQNSVQSNGTVKKTVYDIDSRTGEMITIEVEHYRYRCKNPDCKESFTLDVLPFKCFPDTPSDGRTNKSRSRDILNRAMDYLLLGSDENGNPVTVSAAAKKFGYDRKVIATELHARVNAAIEEHVSSNETCAQAAIVPFIYRGVMRCAYIGYIQKDGAEELIPVLYDIRDRYNQEDLEKYLTEHRHQGVVVPEVTYLDMDESIINMVLNLYVEEYQAKKSKKTGETNEDSFFFGTVKDIVRKKINSIEGPELSNEFGIRDSFRYYKRKLEAHLYDKDLYEGDDDLDDVLVDADFSDTSFYEILDDWMEEVQPTIVAEKLRPLYESLYEYADSIDVSMSRYREDGVRPEDELTFVHYFHKRNVDFEEMRYRVHLLSKNNQNISFQSLITGQYKPTSRKTLRRYYIDLREINTLFKD